MFVLATQAPPGSTTPPTASPTATPPSPVLRLMLQPPTGQRYSRECEIYVVVSRLNVYNVALRSGLSLPLVDVAYLNLVKRVNRSFSRSENREDRLKDCILKYPHTRYRTMYMYWVKLYTIYEP